VTDADLRAAVNGGLADRSALAGEQHLERGRLVQWFVSP
jgi:hypothetical protein